MDTDIFQESVDKAIDSLPKEFKEKLNNVSVFIEDYPTPTQVTKLKLREGREYLLGLYEGIPQTKRAYYGIGGPMPDRIFIFKYPILSLVRSKDELVEQIRSTVLHEIGHHFGMSEEEIRSAESARSRKKSL